MKLLINKCLGILFMSNFILDYILDDRLSKLLNLDKYGTFTYNAKDDVIDANYLFQQIAIKIDKTEEELLTTLVKIDDTGEEKGVSSFPTIRTYEYDERNLERKRSYLDSRLSIIEELKIRIDRMENLNEILMEYDAQSEHKGVLFKEIFYDKNTGNIQFAFCGGFLVYYDEMR